MFISSGDLLNTPVTPDTSILQVVEPLFSTVVAADPILEEPTAPVGLPVITE